MNELLSFLSAIHPLSPELRAHLESILRAQECKKKELLLDIGQVCSWFMKEGDVIGVTASRTNIFTSNSYQLVRQLIRVSKNLI